MLKRIALWSVAVVFLVLDALGIVFCAYLATVGKPSEFLDDNLLVLLSKIGVGIGLGALIILVVRDQNAAWHGSTTKAAAQGQSYDGSMDTYRQLSQESADSEPYPC